MQEFINDKSLGIAIIVRFIKARLFNPTNSCSVVIDGTDGYVHFFMSLLHRGNDIINKLEYTLFEKHEN